jgi:hypothetical protein
MVVHRHVYCVLAKASNRHVQFTLFFGVTNR